MTIYLNPTKEQKEEMARSIAQSKMKENWAHLLEVILEDSTLEEILAFALRLDEIPRYTQEEERRISAFFIKLKRPLYAVFFIALVI